MNLGALRKCFKGEVSDQELAEMAYRLPSDTAYFNALMLPEIFTLKMPSIHNQIYKIMNDKSITLAVINMPRSWGKTSICQGFCIQQLVNQIHKVILFVSDTLPQASIHTNSIREQLEINERITALYGDQKGQTWGTELFTTSGGCSVVPRGAMQGIRGVKIGPYRPSLIFLDDMENDEGVLTSEQRDKLWGVIFGAIMPVIRHRTGNIKILMFGTLLHQDSALMRMMILVNEMRAKGRTDLLAVSFDSEDEEGHSTWPEAMPDESLRELKEIYTKAGQIHTYYREYRGKLISSEDAHFKPEYFGYWSELPKDLQHYTTIDAAFKPGLGNDYSALVTFGLSPTTQNIYVEHAVRKRVEPVEFLEMLQANYDTYQPVYVFVQKVVLDQLLAYWAKHLGYRLPFKIVPLPKGKGGKIARISSIQPLVMSKELLFHSSQSDLIAELLSFPIATHDDIGDALATGIGQVWKPSRRIVAQKPGNYVHEIDCSKLVDDIMRKSGEVKYGFSLPLH